MTPHGPHLSNTNATDERFAGSFRHHARARRTLAGGVATAFRAAQQPVPICFASGHGPRLFDIDGNEYVDYALAFGPMLLGHAPPSIVRAVERQLSTGFGYGASHLLEAQLAEAVCRTVPSADLCVFNSTGSEAVHAALRIARSATGRSRIVKFQGHYHGWLDPMHIGVPGRQDDAAGTGGQVPIPPEVVTVARWNDLDSLREVLGPDVAAVIMEPLNVNGGCLVPDPGYLEEARRLTQDAGALLIFDEVITGYRVSLGGAQELYGVQPDLTILGKALGGGLPISAVCGSESVMEEVVSSRVAHVGTFNANPICAAAAVAAIEELERRADDLYSHLEEMAKATAEVIQNQAAANGLPIVVNHCVGVAHAFVSHRPIRAYSDTAEADFDLYRSFAAALLEHSVHVIPRGLLYVSTTHDRGELALLEQAVAAAAGAVSDLAAEPA